MYKLGPFGPGPCWTLFICWALLGPWPCWAHSRGFICWAMLGPFVCWAPGPVGAIHLLRHVVAIHLMGPVGPV